MMTSMLRFIVVCNGYLCVTLRAFDYLQPPAPWMQNDYFQTTAESICGVHVRRKGRFSAAARWFDKSLCYALLPFGLM